MRKLSWFSDAKESGDEEVWEGAQAMSTEGVLQPCPGQLGFACSLSPGSLLWETLILAASAV